MGHKAHNKNRMFGFRDKQNEVEMIMFCNHNFVVQNKRKIKGIMHYDIIGVHGSSVSDLRFVGVPHDLLVANKKTSDESTFKELTQRYSL